MHPPATAAGRASARRARYRGGGVAVEQNWHSADAAAHIFNGGFGSLLSIGSVAALEVTTAYFWSYDRVTGTSTTAVIYYGGGYHNMPLLARLLLGAVAVTGGAGGTSRARR